MSSTAIFHYSSCGREAVILDPAYEIRGVDGDHGLFIVRPLETATRSGDVVGVGPSFYYGGFPERAVPVSKYPTKEAAKEALAKGEGFILTRVETFARGQERSR